MTTREEIIRFLDSDDEDTLEHFGVKGMKWGVIREKVSAHRQAKADEKARLNKPNPDYTTQQRGRDRAAHGKSSEKRINRAMNQGKTLVEARKMDQKHRVRQSYIVSGALMTAYLINALGPTVMNEISRKAATNRDKRAQATEDYIRNGPQKPATKNAKKNFRGVYNVTTM